MVGLVFLDSLYVFKEKSIYFKSGFDMFWVLWYVVMWKNVQF